MEVAMPDRRPLVDAAELAAELRSERPPVLLDVRWSVAGGPAHADYAAGHLPGARFVDLDKDLAAPPGAGGRHPLPDQHVFEAAMRRCGVSNDRPVVVYDAADATSAARAWWLLGWFGHGDVRVLDGGVAAWTAAGLPLSTDVPAPRGGDFRATPGGRALLDAQGAAELARSGVLLDARTAVRYRGEQEPVDPVAGHIPGARSTPAAGNVDAAGRLLPAAELRARLAGLGATGGVEVGAYCGSGVLD